MSRRLGRQFRPRLLSRIQHAAAAGAVFPCAKQLADEFGVRADSINAHLNALHDAGLITLRQRGMRRVPVLPDGRSCL